MHSNMVQMNCLKMVFYLRPMKVIQVKVIGNLTWLNYPKQARSQDARKLLCGTVRPEEMEEIYLRLYDNVTLFGDEEKQDQAVLII